MNDDKPLRKQDLPFAWQQDLWDTAAPFRQQLDAKRKVAEAKLELEQLKQERATRTSTAAAGAALPASSSVSSPAFARSAAAGGRERLSRREKLFRAQTFVCPDIDANAVEQERPGGDAGEAATARKRERHVEELRDRALGVVGGG